jgi:hypothetical protein
VETGNNKIQPGHLLIDEAFDSNSSSSQHLSIQLSLDGLSFCIRTNGKVQLLKSYGFHRIFNWQQISDEVEAILTKEQITGKKYLSVHISIIHQKFSLIPSPLFDPLRQKEYLKINSDFEANDLISNEFIKSIDARNVFAVPLVVEKMLRRNFGACKISHHTSVLLDSLFNLLKNTPEPQLVLNINKGNFDIILIDGNKLLFCNSFKHYADEDVIYYLLFACEQLKLNPENISITISGQIEKNSALYELLNKYLRKISFINRPQNLNYSYKFDELQGHSFYGLLSQ